MLRPSEFRDIVSGRRKGVVATLARSVLRVAEVPYTVAVSIRNWRYDHGAAGIHNVDVPIITIGNLSRNRYWGESDDRAYRPAICTCTLISGDGFRLLVDPSL